MSEQHRCHECNSWAGRCKKGRKNRISISEACEDFQERDAALSFISDCLDTIIEVCAVGDKTFRAKT